jgi:hypothetical protein
MSLPPAIIISGRFFYRREGKLGIQEFLNVIQRGNNIENVFYSDAGGRRCSVLAKQHCVSSYQVIEFELASCLAGGFFKITFTA